MLQVLDGTSEIMYKHIEKLMNVNQVNKKKVVVAVQCEDVVEFWLIDSGHLSPDGMTDLCRYYQNHRDGYEDEEPEMIILKQI